MRTLIAESVIPEQPPFFVLSKTSRAVGIWAPDRATLVLPVRPWLEVEFWRQGEQIMEPEARALLDASVAWKWTAAELLWWPR